MLGVAQTDFFSPQAKPARPAKTFNSTNPASFFDSDSDSDSEKENKASTATQKAPQNLENLRKEKAKLEHDQELHAPLSEARIAIEEEIIHIVLCIEEQERLAKKQTTQPVTAAAPRQAL